MERIKKIIAGMVCCLSFGCANNYVYLNPSDACGRIRVYSTPESFEFYKAGKLVAEYRLSACTKEYLQLRAKQIVPENFSCDEILLKLCEDADANKDGIVSLIEARRK